MRKNVALFALIVIVIGIAAYLFRRQNTVNHSTNTQAKKLVVTTSFYPLYFFAKEIVGDQATVYNLTPAGAEPHDYEPTARDIMRLETSHLIIIHGGLEPWAERLKTDWMHKG